MIPPVRKKDGSKSSLESEKEEKENSILDKLCKILQTCSRPCPCHTQLEILIRPIRSVFSGTKEQDKKCSTHPTKVRSQDSGLSSGSHKLSRRLIEDNIEQNAANNLENSNCDTLRAKSLRIMQRKRPRTSIVSGPQGQNNKKPTYQLPKTLSTDSGISCGSPKGKKILNENDIELDIVNDLEKISCSIPSTRSSLESRTLCHGQPQIKIPVKRLLQDFSVLQRQPNKNPTYHLPKDMTTDSEISSRSSKEMRRVNDINNNLDVVNTSKNVRSSTRSSLRNMKENLSSTSSVLVHKSQSLPSVSKLKQLIPNKINKRKSALNEGEVGKKAKKDDANRIEIEGNMETLEIQGLQVCDDQQGDVLDVAKANEKLSQEVSLFKNPSKRNVTISRVSGRTVRPPLCKTVINILVAREKDEEKLKTHSSKNSTQCKLSPIQGSNRKTKKIGIASSTPKKVAAQSKITPRFSLRKSPMPKKVNYYPQKSTLTSENRSDSIVKRPVGRPKKCLSPFKNPKKLHLSPVKKSRVSKKLDLISKERSGKNKPTETFSTIKKLPGKSRKLPTNKKSHERPPAPNENLTFYLDNSFETSATKTNLRKLARGSWMNTFTRSQLDFSGAMRSQNTRNTSPERKSTASPKPKKRKLYSPEDFVYSARFLNLLENN